MSITPRDDVSPEDLARAALYRVVASFLTRPPGSELLRAGARLEGDDTPLGRALTMLAVRCSQTTSEQAAEAFQVLFIGIGRGELVPFGSYYLTGFLQEKPLARLRAEMERLGIERGPDESEPEDHIASVLEMMAGLIDGVLGPPLSIDEQRKFFDAHVGSWAGHFFADLSQTKTSPLYQAVGEIGARLMSVEREAFLMG